MLWPEWSECVSFSTLYRLRSRYFIPLILFYIFFFLCFFIVFIFCFIFFSFVVLPRFFFPSYIKWLDNVISLKFTVTQIKEIIEDEEDKKETHKFFTTIPQTFSPQMNRDRKCNASAKHFFQFPCYTALSSQTKSSSSTIIKTTNVHLKCGSES